LQLTFEEEMTNRRMGRFCNMVTFTR